MIARGTTVTVLLLLLGSIALPTLAEERLNRRQLDSILLAITDGIYAQGYNVHYRDLDPARVRVYVKADAVGQFWILYRLLPHGEVLRPSSERLGQPRMRSVASSFAMNDDSISCCARRFMSGRGR